MYDGKIIISEAGRMGYVSQFAKFDHSDVRTVFAYLSEPFVAAQAEIDRICKAMESGENLEALMEAYQTALDASMSIDADHYESNIYKQLKLAGLQELSEQQIAVLSGGEFKLIQIMREMLIQPQLLIMDEPDVYLDFENLNGLVNLINAHKGTMLVVTHNRYLLNHCFDKIIQLENAELQEFDGRYIEYNFSRLLAKIEQQELAAADQEEIERNQKLVEKLRREATTIASTAKGKALRARVSLVERLEARKIKAPFVDLRQPQIALHTTKELEDTEVLAVQDYSVRFEDDLLEQVSFTIGAKDKVAIVGANGTGKTTLLRELYQNSNPAIHLSEQAETAFLSQVPGEFLDESATVLDTFYEEGFETDAAIKEYLSGYCLDEEAVTSKVGELSGGEKNLLQLARIATGDANFLLMDEPTSHLDTYSQIALEKAVADFNGTVLMVSHDFYTIANCADYVLLVADKTVRQVSIRKFRKMIYASHFHKDYLELEQKKKELEGKVEAALKGNHFEQAQLVAEELEQVIEKM